MMYEHRSIKVKCKYLAESLGTGVRELTRGLATLLQVTVSI